jgi:hypothetical protein
MTKISKFHISFRYIVQNNLNKSSFYNLCLEILHTIWANLNLLCTLDNSRKVDAHKERDETNQ